MSKLAPSWLGEAAVQRLLAALAAAGIEARFVGGCVRDALLGAETGDLDLATPARPEPVMAALAAAKIRALPTGIAHGTVTAIIGSKGPPRIFEITTLRRDVETDGRHAVVAFGADWAEDARRRDFTINAIYLAPDATLYDPVGGQADLAARRVRFVGDAATRIAEDVLRVLRYYRFEGRFGGGDGNPEARAACREAAGRLRTLSAERVSRELLRLIGGPAPVRVLKMMRDDGVLATVLPEATRLDRLRMMLALPRLRGRERADVSGDASADPGSAASAQTTQSLPPPPPAGEGRGGGLSGDPILHLAALADVDHAGAVALAERLRLAARDRKRLAALAKPWPLGPGADAKAQRLAFYRVGRDTFLGTVMLLLAEGTLAPETARDMFALAGNWHPPIFPLGGDDVTALGIAPGPRVGRLLAEARRWWEDGDFTADRAACLGRLREIANEPP